MKTRTHSDRAIAAAIETMGSPHPQTAAVTLFFAMARHMARVVDDPNMVADELATGREP
jgi:phytoene/squalene synthetase